MALKGSTDTAAMAVKKPGFTKSYFKNGIIGNLKILIVITVLNLLSFPVALISLTYDLHMESLLDEYEYYEGTSVWFIVIAFLFSIVAILAGVIIALNSFSYLYKKQNVDMYISLPLKNSQRFLCDYFSGLTCYIGPFLLSGVVTFIISLFTINIVPQINNEFMYGLDLPGVIIRCYLVMAAVMVMLYTLTVLVSSICGNLFETIFYTLLINGLIPGMIAIIVFISLGNAFGLMYEDYITPLLSKTSPIGALIGLTLYSQTHGDDYIWTWGFMAKYSLALVAVSALYAIAAYLLYKHRKAEDVSKPFVYNVFYYIIMAVIMLAMSAFVVIDGDGFAAPIIVFMIVVYLVFEVVNKRGFKKFRYSFIRCAVTIAACLGISLLCKSTNGFGISYRVPDADDVKSVTLTYTGPDCMNEFYYYYEDAITDENSITVVDTETIENIIAAHKSIIEKYSAEDPYDPDASYSVPYTDTALVVMKYNLKNGTSFTRQYRMTADELYYLDTVCKDSNYEAEMARVLEELFIERDTICVCNIFDSNMNAVLEPTTDDEFKRAAKAVAQAYAKDVAGRSIEQIRTPSESPLAKFEIYYDYALYIYPWDTNVINTLMEYNIAFVQMMSGPENVNDYTDDDLPGFADSIDRVYCYDDRGGEYYSYVPVTEYISNFTGGYYSHDDYHGVIASHYMSDPERALKLQKQLLEVAVPHYDTTEPLYKIAVQNEIFMIPPEYTSVAKEYYDMLMEAHDRYDEEEYYY